MLFKKGYTVHAWIYWYRSIIHTICSSKLPFYTVLENSFVRDDVKVSMATYGAVLLDLRDWDFSAIFPFHL